jgi:hypothetical protein
MSRQVDGSMTAEPVPLSQLGLDVPEPPAGWVFELERRGIPIVLDDIGRPSISRDAARDLLAKRHEQQQAAARRREAIERRVIEADQRFRASLPAGIPAGAVPEGISAGQLMMLSDPMQGSRRESVVADALKNDGRLIYRPIRDEQADQ